MKPDPRPVDRRCAGDSAGGLWPCEAWTLHGARHCWKHATDTEQKRNRMSQTRVSQLNTRASVERDGRGYERTALRMLIGADAILQWASE